VVRHGVRVICGTSDEDEAACAEFEAARVVSSITARPHSVPSDSAIAALASEMGWEGEAVAAACVARISTLASVLACTPAEAADILVKHPEIHAVRDGHIAACLMTLREILPGVDATNLVRHVLHSVRWRAGIAKSCPTRFKTVETRNSRRQVCRKVDLVLQEDAMERARAAVCTIQRKGFNPSELVDARPLVLLRHDVWFAESEESCSWDETGAFEHDAP